MSNGNGKRAGKILPRDKFTSVTVKHGVVEVTNSATGDVLEVHAGESVFRENDGLAMEHFRDGESMSREARRQTKKFDRMERRDHDSARKERHAADHDRRGPEDNGDDDGELAWVADGDHLGNDGKHGGHYGREEDDVEEIDWGHGGSKGKGKGDEDFSVKQP